MQRRIATVSLSGTLSALASPGVHHIALACDDIFSTVELDEQLRRDGILYDSSLSDAFLHVPTAAFHGCFSCEIVQRVAPAYLR